MSINIKMLENFLTAVDLNELQSLKMKETKNAEMNVYVQKIEPNNNVTGSGIPSNTVKRLHKKYHLTALDILNELNPKKTSLYEYSEFGITDTGTNYNFPIHNDDPNKLLSGVIYLSPKKSVGTKFYQNKKGDDEKHVDWKINRAVFFSREEKLSWHSFNNDGNEIRRVLIYNLMTANIKEVCRIEKINYFYVKFKHFINPYLYRFFRFVI